MSATVKRNMKYCEPFAIEEKQITERSCLSGTSGWFALIKFSDVSSCY